jgi:hypothetical protein
MFLFIVKNWYSQRFDLNEKYQKLSALHEASGPYFASSLGSPCQV